MYRHYHVNPVIGCVIFRYVFLKSLTIYDRGCRAVKEEGGLLLLPIPTPVRFRRDAIKVFLHLSDVNVLDTHDVWR